MFPAPVPGVVQLKTSGLVSPISLQTWLLANVTTVPYEGLWLPSNFCQNLSLEVLGTFTTASVQLYGTNAESVINTQTVTLGGSFAQNDVLTLSFTSPTGAPITVSVTLGASPTATTAATQLAAAVNSALPFMVSASAAAGVITLYYPSWLAGDPFQVIQNSNVLQNLFTVTGSTTGSETFTVTNGTDGSTLGAAITTAGLTQLAVIPRWIKARVTALTGSGAFIYAALQGCG